MAKLATIAYDENGRVNVSHAELPPRPPATASATNPIPRRRVPSSPHKPFTSTNFYDLTRSDAPSSDTSPRSVITLSSASSRSTSPSDYRVMPESDQENILPRPDSHAAKPDVKALAETPTPSENSGKPFHFMDPTTLLPPNSSLWKLSKVDLRKQGRNDPNLPRSSFTSLSNNAIGARDAYSGSASIPRPIPPPLAAPRNPPWIPPSSFIHPDTIGFEPVFQEQHMTEGRAEEALKEFFESALEPEKEEQSKTGDGNDDGGTVQGLHVTLMKHQIEGLKFLQDHECMSDKPGKGKGKYGGILADEMGLGKTIQTLALILTHPRPVEKSTIKECKGTLLIVPLALVDQWRLEIAEKTTLKSYVHHGPKRESDPNRLVKFDVVITTYDTVSSELHSKGKEASVNGRGVFLVNWWRIVLDEAHTIKNPKAKMSIACCALASKFRWCLTGTPYQNTADDVYSLVKFLQIPPFVEWNYWRERISGPAKNGRMSLALTRLRTLLRAIMIRRTKEILKQNGVFLPSKEVISEELEFDEVERRFYDDLCLRGQKTIEELKSLRGGLQKNYMCLLTMLLRLRQATDHIDLLKGKLDDEKDAINEKPAEPNNLSKDDDDLVAMMSGLGIEAKCAICFRIITNGRERCDGCDKSLDKFKSRKSGGSSSSKIRRMLDILKQKIDGVPVKTIIFSQFTSMLDLIEPFLCKQNIEHGRYDGKMRKDQRDKMLHLFRTTSMPVLLVSLKSGSVGLNLTAASRVIMLDMWWNPAIEDQAIDRVHRIGQTKRVVVHKLTIRNSIDERIGALQQQKREAANGVLGEAVIKRKGGAPNKLSLEEVMFLFSMPEEAS